ncbi:RNA-binding protein [Photobacterium frigidiphilum]|uniref:RNA-binding protein n=1 Tax=Photobacterium frigidiphilum TaxID=264736 RepID=A0A2T3JH34_9GAMM|nr:DUF3850 domain-containing protein [Photobacterium frigidiphilum]PSU48277.1 RNA-binding protein [Photobacterium frigidiphilum]
MKQHSLKIRTEYLNAILDGDKTFEIRENDRDFKVGDRIHLSDGNRYLVIRIKYITDFAQQDGYIVFSFDWIEGGKL